MTTVLYIAFLLMTQEMQYLNETNTKFRIFDSDISAQAFFIFTGKEDKWKSHFFLPWWHIIGTNPWLA